MAKTKTDRKFSTSPGRIEEIKLMNYHIKNYKRYRALAQRAATAALRDYWAYFAAESKRQAYEIY